MIRGIHFYRLYRKTLHKTLNELHWRRQTLFVTVRIEENNRDFEKIDGQGTPVGGGLLTWLNPCRDRAPGRSSARKISTCASVKPPREEREKENSVEGFFLRQRIVFTQV